MTEQELQEIRERLEAATPGPWEANYQALKNLIEHAPNDIRRLLDEVEHLKHSISCATCAECADQVGDKWELFNYSIYCSNCINYVKEIYNDK